MKFITLEPAEFTKFAKKSPYKSFLQTTEIASLREKNGWIAYYFGVEESGKLIAAAMVVAKPTFLGKSTYYIPGGPLLDYENTTLVNFFFKNLKHYAKTHNGFLLHIEPNYELIERDRDGKAKPGGFSHQKALQNLKNLGFITAESDNPKYHFVLDLKKQSEDKLFSSFKQNTRNLISRAERKGVTVRELTREELPLFKQITTSTSERRHFTDKTLDYYETMYDLFAKRGEVKYLIAEIAGTKPSAAEHKDSTKAARGTLKEHTVSVSTPIAAAMFMLYGDEVIYLFSGSDEKYMKEYNAQYLIQWRMIKHALKNGFKHYNFYGIQGLPDPNSKGYGIYRFKKGFTTPANGRVVELLGAFEFPINQPFYHLRRILVKLKK